MKDRIEKLMKLEGLASGKFAEILSVQPSNISHILSGRNKPSYDFIMKIIERFPQVNIEWLMTGMGSVYKSNTHVDPNLITNVTSNFEENYNAGDPRGDTLHDAPNVHNLSTLPTSDIILEEHVRQSEQNLSKNKSISKIIIFYSDATFELFQN